MLQTHVAKGAVRSKNRRRRSRQRASEMLKYQHLCRDFVPSSVILGKRSPCSDPTGLPAGLGVKYQFVEFKIPICFFATEGDHSRSTLPRGMRCEVSHLSPDPYELAYAPPDVLDMSTPQYGFPASGYGPPDYAVGSSGAIFAHHYRRS